jgi:hypothetical protein
MRMGSSVAMPWSLGGRILTLRVNPTKAPRLAAAGPIDRPESPCYPWKGTRVRRPSDPEEERP